MGHNESNTRRLNEAAPGEEAQIIKRTFATIARAAGAPPKGWLSSGLQETWDTLDLLAAEGGLYVCDWCNDDQPYVMHLDGGRRLVSVPYAQQTNDKPAYERMLVSPGEFRDMICRTFDVLYREGAASGRVMAIALHPYISGMPHRIGALDAALEYICKHDGVWRATGAEIAEHYLSPAAAAHRGET
jgi:allantoinase